jgi:hypothetical protein
MCPRAKGKIFSDYIHLGGSSNTWYLLYLRSILKGLELLKEGLIWRVGDGSSINIWSDPWISRDGTRRPLTPRGNCLLTRVSELICPVTMTWDDMLVRDIFSEEDVKIILATPIREDFEDFHAWHYDEKGAFWSSRRIRCISKTEIMQLWQLLENRCRMSLNGKGFGRRHANQRFGNSYGGSHTIVYRLS